MCMQSIQGLVLMQVRAPESHEWPSGARFYLCRLCPHVPSNCFVAWLSSQMAALTCAIGTIVPVGTVQLATALWLYNASHLLTSTLMSHSKSDIYVDCSCIAAGCVLHVHIICMRIVDAVFFIMLLTLPWVLNIHASNYVSAASTHISKLPP